MRTGKVDPDIPNQAADVTDHTFASDLVASTQPNRDEANDADRVGDGHDFDDTDDNPFLAFADDSSSVGSDSTCTPIGVVDDMIDEGESFSQTSDASTSAELARLHEVADSIADQYAMFVNARPPRARRLHEVSRLTMSMLAIVTVIFIVAEAALAWGRTSTTNLIVLGIGELMLYSLVVISAYYDFFHSSHENRSAELESRVSCLTDELKKLTSMRNDVMSTLVSLTVQRDQSQAELSNLQTENLHLKEACTENQELVDASKQSLLEVGHQIDREKEELAKKTADVIVANERLEQVQKELESVQELLEQSKREKDSTHEELIKIQTELRFNHANQEKITLKVGELNEKVQQTTDELQQRQTELQTNREQLEQTWSQIQEQEELELEIAHQQEMLSELRKTEEELNERLSNAETERKIAQLESRAEFLRQEIKQEQSRLDEIHSEREQARNELDESRRAHLAVTGDLAKGQAACDEHHRRLAELIQAQERLSTEMQRMQSGIDELQNHCEIKSREKNALATDIDAIQMDFREKLSQLTAVEEACRETEKQEEAAQLRLKSLEGKNESLRDMLNSRKEQIVEAKKQHSVLRDQVAQADQVAEELETRRQELEQLIERITEVDAAVVNAEQRQNEYSQQLDSIVREIDSKRAESDLATKTLSDLQSQIEDTRINLVQLSDEQSSEAERHLDEMNHLQTQANAIREQIQDLSLQRADLEVSAFVVIDQLCEYGGRIEAR